jgi:hypothetical protein
MVDMTELEEAALTEGQGRPHSRPLQRSSVRNIGNTEEYDDAV